MSILDKILPGRRHQTAGAVDTARRPPGFGGERRLTAAQVKEIRRRNGEGESQSKLAREFGVKQPSIYAIVQRQTYKDVE